jgi:DNA-binding GntR family transcriptional regulator
MTIVVKPLSEQIYSLVRERIISGEIPTDVGIRQDALAKELGVSKIPLREAFARLERDGLLLSITNRGFFVHPLSVDECEEVYALRLKIEPDAVGRAAAEATDEDREAAQIALKAMDVPDVKDKAPSGRLNRDFHMSLIRPIKQRITMQIIERINILAERYACKHLEPSGRRDRARKEHTAIYETWASGKSKTVESMMYDHIFSTLTDLRKQF